MIRVVHQGRKVLLDHKEQMVPRDLKAPPVQKGRKVQPAPKEIPEVLLDQPVPLAQTGPQDPKALKDPWEKSAQPT